MAKISSISEFLLEAGTDYRIIDMGRGFHQIDSQTFLDIENSKIPPLYPRQQMLWLGILFWNKQLSQQHYIWFVKLPLDEQGLLIGAQRDQFLQVIIEALGTEMLESDEEKSLPENPWLFTPTQPQIAHFNSLARQLLNLGPGQYYQGAKNYIARPDINNWQEIALQGISDLAFYLGQDHNSKHLINNFEKYSSEVQLPLLAALENVNIGIELQDFLLQKLQQTDHKSPLFNALLRALAKSESPEPLKLFLQKILTASEVTQDNLIVTVGRHWKLLQDYGFLTLVLEQAVQLNIFVSLYADIVQLPELRTQVLKRLRDPERSDLMAKGLDQLFTGSN